MVAAAGVIRIIDLFHLQNKRGPLVAVRQGQFPLAEGCCRCCLSSGVCPGRIEALLKPVLPAGIKLPTFLQPEPHRHPVLDRVHLSRPRRAAFGPSDLLPRFCGVSCCLWDRGKNVNLQQNILKPEPTWTSLHSGNGSRRRIKATLWYIDGSSSVLSDCSSTETFDCEV